MLRKLLIISFPLLLTSCSAVPINNYAGYEPKFNLMQYFEGKTKAWGQFQTRNGELKRRFTVDITGTVTDSPKGKQLLLDEHFEYDDGETQQRIWTITEIAPNTYEGKADDVIGVARGQSAGSVLNWQYTLDLPYKGSNIHVKFDDWMFLQDKTTMINRATVTKFGFTVGEVTLFFRKES